MNKTEIGQSMIELVIGLGLLVVVVTILAIATLNGLKNSQYSKNQIQATKLAQEGLERVRAIRERNYLVCGGPGTAPDWSTLYQTAMTCDGNPQCYYILKQTAAGACGAPPATPIWLSKIVTNSNTLAEPVDGDNIKFYRVITIKDFAGTQLQKEITVTVSWTDISGDHSSKIVTVFAQ